MEEVFYGDQTKRQTKKDLTQREQRRDEEEGSGEKRIEE
jgi:hypothetical protein